jgi:ribosomal protein S18 acetylase RimI-like enzyme
VAPSLRPLTATEAETFAASRLAAYIDERIGAGERPAEARRIAEQQHGVAFPGGRPARGHYVYFVVDDTDEVIGSVWIGPRTPGNDKDYWVWDIEIAEPARGRGLGRAAMVLGQDEARARGATTLGLNVFGANTVARALYESLGYETTSLQMRKRL